MHLRRFFLAAAAVTPLLGLMAKGAQADPISASDAQAFIASAVVMTHPPGNHIGHGFKSPVGVVRKPPNIVVRVVVAKGVQH